MDGIVKYLFYFVVTACILTACKGRNKKEQAQKLTIVTTTGMIADLVKNIGGDSVEVQALMGPGVDPHLYKATQGDLGRLQKAAVIFYNGLHLEGKMGEVFEKLERIKKVVPIAARVDTAALLQNPVYQDAHDPHIWFDVSLWLTTVKVVLQVLTEADPENAPLYMENAARYQKQLSALHEWVKQEISSIPAKNRIMITAHDAFNYFGRAYGVEVRGLQGVSTLSEFGLRDRVDLVNYIVEKQIKAVFLETSVSQKNINAIIEGCRQKGHEVVIGGSLYSDAMGAAGTPEGTYIGMVKSNVNALVKSLK